MDTIPILGTFPKFNNDILWQLLHCYCDILDPDSTFSNIYSIVFPAMTKKKAIYGLDIYEIKKAIYVQIIDSHLKFK